MSLSQALQLARVELAGLSGTRKVRRLGQIVKLFAAEVAGTVALAPFALKAQQLYNRLPPPNKDTSTPADDVCLVKSIYYGTKPRNTLDLYLPPEAQQQHLQPGLPVVLFVHGGVWAAGDSWHYAPLAASLARLGVITCVMQYTLYPDALVPQLVQEVSAAFDWALDNVGSYGGDPRKVSLVGHSAGAQLCMMALLQRAQALHAATTAAAAEYNTNSNPQQQQQQHLQMPHQFVGVTGVYDIAKHYAYEKDRGVHSLSTMLPAMGGFHHFAANSPSVILAAALQQQLLADQQQLLADQATAMHLPGQQQQQCGGTVAAAGSTQQQQQQQQQQRGQLQELPACDFYSSFSLSGEGIAHRIGFDRGSDHHFTAEAGLTAQSLCGMSAVQQFPVEAAAYLPPVVLLSSCTDLTVPWYESAELYWRLFDCDVPVKHLVYNKVGHGEFVTEWPAAFTTNQPHQQDTNNHQHHLDNSSSSRDINDNGSHSSTHGPPHSLQQQRSGLIKQLPPFCQDLAVVVRGEGPVNFVHRSKVQQGYSRAVTAAAGVRAAGQQEQQLMPVLNNTRSVNKVVDRPHVPSEWN